MPAVARWPPDLIPSAGGRKRAGWETTRPFSCACRLGRSAELLLEFVEREGRLGRFAALVLLGRIGADQGLLFVLDRQDAVADGRPSIVSAMIPRALSPATISK
jgi:hypothetical protein